MPVRTAAPYRCPSCNGELNETPDGLNCSTCSRRYPRNSGYVDFLPDETEPSRTPLEETFFELIPPLYEDYYFPSLYRLGTLPGFESPETHAEELIERTGVRRGKVLDVACGTGMLSRKLASGNRRVHALDRSKGMLREALKRLPDDLNTQIEYCRGDAFELPFQPDSFRAVTCTGAFYLFPDLETPLREMKRVLKPGGRLAGMTVVKQGVLNNSLVDWLLKQYRRIGHYRMHEMDSFRRNVRNAGFNNIEFQRYGCVLLFQADHPNYRL